uniref:Mos1 transposase HTH domain-containing protein n=1 Tax=Cynoglossus semilaevis TaxID=244447 RepID=A0A3P8VRL0_CYNSE
MFYGVLQPSKKMNNFEIRANVKFLTKLEWKPGKIVEALQQVYGDSSPSRAVVHAWVKRFKEGKEELQDEPKDEKASAAKNEQMVELVRGLVEEDQQITVDAITNEVGIPYGLAFSILTEDLGLHRLSGRWVPKSVHEDKSIDVSAGKTDRSDDTSISTETRRSSTSIPQRRVNDT